MWTRRNLLRTISAAAAAAPFVGAAPAIAQSGGLLERLRRAGTIRIGIANQPPYSGMNPDGSVAGFVPVLVQTIMAKLGIAKVEPLVATYGQLVPGLQAGRWDMIGASFRINKERCTQVHFTDPVTFDGGAIAYVPGDMPNPARNLGDLARAGTKIGVLQGSYLVRLAESKGVVGANISQFPSNPALIDGLLAKRAQVVVSTNASLQQLRRMRNGGFEIIYPVPDDPPVGSGPAFRREDNDIYEAFQRELRAMRTSGDLEKLGVRFGFETPAELRGTTAEQACARVS